MAESILTNRESLIFKTLITSFITSATPIGSSYLSKINNNRLSSATIRNIMGDLEAKGLVIQPHKSAGRIPTNSGYRCYVDELMKIEKLAQNEREVIDKKIGKMSNEDIEAILEKSCEVLAKISNQLGVVLSPRFYQGKFEKLELVDLSENKILVVIKIQSGLIKTIMMEIISLIPKNKLEETARILNERLSGLTLSQIRESIVSRMKGVSSGDENLLSQFTESADKIFSIEDSQLHFKGTKNIFKQPEFCNQERISEILELIDNKDILIHLFNNSQNSEEQVSITIGEENREDLISSCSLITSTYKIGEITGTIGIVGPTRMKYDKVTSLVGYIAKEINKLFI